MRSRRRRGAVIRSSGLRLIYRGWGLRLEDARTPWTRDYHQGQEITVVLKSGGGAPHKVFAVPLGVARRLHDLTTGAIT